MFLFGNYQIFKVFRCLCVVVFFMYNVFNKVCLGKDLCGCSFSA